MRSSRITREQRRGGRSRGVFQHGCRADQPDVPDRLWEPPPCERAGRHIRGPVREDRTGSIEALVWLLARSWPHWGTGSLSGCGAPNCRRASSSLRRPRPYGPGHAGGLAGVRGHHARAGDRAIAPLRCAAQPRVPVGPPWERPSAPRWCTPCTPVRTRMSAALEPVSGLDGHGDSEFQWRDVPPPHPHPAPVIHHGLDVAVHLPAVAGRLCLLPRPVHPRQGAAGSDRGGPGTRDFPDHGRAGE
jgi:hypothetical protein